MVFLVIQSQIYNVEKLCGKFMKWNSGEFGFLSLVSMSLLLLS